MPGQLPSSGVGPSSGRDLYSAHRSLLRYLSFILPAPWDVQPTRAEPATRPMCVCQPLLAASVASQQRGSGERGWAYIRDYQVPFEIMAYPPGVDGEPVGAYRLATQAYEALMRAFDTGRGSPVGTKDQGYSMRVPMYDWTGLAFDQDQPPDAQPFTYLVIGGLYGSVRQDPEQDDLYTVLIDLRASWADDGDTSRFDGNALQQIQSMGLRLDSP